MMKGLIFPRGITILTCIPANKALNYMRQKLIELQEVDNHYIWRPIYLFKKSFIFLLSTLYLLWISFLTFSIVSFDMQKF